MPSKQVRNNRIFLGWMLLILLTAVCLRLAAISSIPPGLTHDEADHGLTAVSILQGEHAIYFSIGHGREPFYDYAVAAMMAAIGSTYLAGRLTAVFFSLLLISAMAAWVRRAFGWQTAVLTAAGLAVGFWPLMAARQSLRSITLPVLFVLAVYFFWRGLAGGKWQVASSKWQVASNKWLPITDYRLPMTDYALSGIFLGLTFYTYIPARALWLIFPMTLVYVGLTQRPAFRQAWRGVLLMLAIAGAMALPLILYLRANPEVEIRIRELSEPLTAVTHGNFAPLWQNIRGGLGIIAFTGDDFWRYNIPGRPLLGPLMALLFGLGLLVALWAVVTPILRRQPDKNWRGAASFLALCWLVVGILPTLVTGPHLSMTQAMGMQPVLYLFPALAIWEIRRLGDWEIRRLAVVVLFVGTAVFTARDYFFTWAQAPEVRVQYEAAMVTAMDYLNEQESTAVSISTITPGPYHTPAVARMMLRNQNITPRWFDGRTSLLIPNAENALVILSGFAPLPEKLLSYWDTENGVETISQPTSDLDRPLTVYEVSAADWLATHQSSFAHDGVTQFGAAAEFLGYDLQMPTGSPAGMVRLVTLWRVGQPTAGLRLFTHVSTIDGILLAQADGLSAPSEAWVAGDLLLQLHEMPLPADISPGQYPLTIGLYTCLDVTCEQTQRLPVDVDARPSGDYLTLQDMTITE